MPVVTMPVKQDNSEKDISRTLRVLCCHRSLAPYIQLSEEECEILVSAALGGNREAEFMMGSLYDAADEPDRAVEWYSRSAARDYLPAMLQLCAVR